jgi:outer membrane protein assembly factor BamB
VKWRRHIPAVLRTIALIATLAAVRDPARAALRAQAAVPPARQPQQTAPAQVLPTASALPLKTFWAVTVADASSVQPGADAGAAYIPLSRPGLTALSLHDGTTAWTVPTAEIVEPPATGDGLVFLAHPQQVAALAARDGSTRWDAQVEGTISAPFLSESGWLLVATAPRRATMLRAATGERLWTRLLSAAVRTRPVAAGHHVFVATDDGRVAALALESGEVLWEARLPAPATTLHPIADRLYAGCSDRFFYCLSADNGDRKWRWRTGGAIIGATVVGDDRVYFASLDNVLRALNLSNGHQVWKASLPHRPTGGPFLFAQLLIVPGISSEVPAFRTLDGRPAGAVKLTAEVSAPATLLPAAPGQPARLLLVSGEGLVQLLGPEAPAVQKPPQTSR